MLTAKHPRDHSFDNIRFFLIFLVVFAHFLIRAVPFTGSAYLYCVIYSFHMPAFLFLTGYFAKFAIKRILKNWVLPYFIFQTLYTLFYTYIMQIDTPLQFLSPQWTLWYLQVCVYFLLLIPLYDIPKKWGQLILWISTLAACLIAGYVDSIGSFLSISRFFVFQPWFLLGYYCRKNQILEKFSALCPKTKRITGILLSVGIIFSACFLFIFNPPITLLHGSSPYSAVQSGAGMRLATVVIALLILAFIFLFLRPLFSRKIFLITQIGQYTLPIYLLHGFVVKTTDAFFPQLLSTPWLLLLLTCAVVVLFGNRFAQGFIDILCLRWHKREP